MKIELATVAALAVTVSAIPLRVITITRPIPHLAPGDVVHNFPPSDHEHGHKHHDDNIMRIKPSFPIEPCSGKSKAMGMGGSPFSDLFTRLGLTRPGPGPAHHHHEHNKWLDSAVHQEGEEKGNMLVEGWKHHVEQMFEGGKNKILPIMEGGEVRILPFLEGDEAGPVPVGGHGRHHHKQGQHLRPHGGHHWRHKGASFGSRLHRAMMHLSPPEAITLAFVLGAGIGSIMHLVFMIFLISLRRIRGHAGCQRSSASREERRAARRERREARKAAKAAKKEGKVRLEGAEQEEVLPSYAEGEIDRLVEKA